MTCFENGNCSKNNIETRIDRSLEKLKSLLNKPYLVDFIKERIGSPNEDTKKKIFMGKLSEYGLSDTEIEKYAHYMIKVMRQQLNPELTPNYTDDTNQLDSLISTMGHIYKLDFYATFRNMEDNPSKYRNLLPSEQAYSFHGDDRKVNVGEEMLEEKQIRELREKGIDPYDISRIRNLSFDTGITHYINTKTGKRESRPSSYLNYNPAFGVNDGIYGLEDYEIINLGNNRYNTKLRFGKFGKTNTWNKDEEPVIDFDFEYYGVGSNSIKVIYQNRSRVLNIQGNNLIIPESFWRDLGFSKRELPHIELNFNNQHQHYRRR